MSHRIIKRLFVILTMLLAVCTAAISAAVFSIAATTAIFVNGTQVSYAGTPTYDHSSGSLRGFFPAHSDSMVIVNYLRTAGILTNFGDPSYDTSEKGGVVNLIKAIEAVRQADPTGQVLVGGESQGADVIADALKILERQGFDTSDITFWVIGNVASTDGGLLTRFPLLGLYIPFIGVTYGEAMDVQYSHVIQVTKQYDGASDLPKYFNPIAIINAALGAFVYGTHFYNDVDPYSPNNVVTTNQSGTVTNILVPHVGTLPILRPLKDLGLPAEIVNALDPFVRALIEIGYDRPDPSVPGSYPDTPVRMQLFPGPDQWVHDAVSVITGLTQTMNRLGAYVHSELSGRVNPSSPPPPVIQDDEVENENSSNRQQTPKIQQPVQDFAAPAPDEPKTTRSFARGGSSPTDGITDANESTAVDDSKPKVSEPIQTQTQPAEEPPIKKPKSNDTKLSEDEGKLDDRGIVKGTVKKVKKSPDLKKDDEQPPSNLGADNTKPGDVKKDDKKDSSDPSSEKSNNTKPE